MVELNSDHLARLLRWHDVLFNENKGILKQTDDDLKLKHRLEVLHEDAIDFEEDPDE